MPCRSRHRGSLAPPTVFRREGDYWTVAYERTVVRLKDAKGLHYIAYLLGHPGQNVHVCDLRAAAQPRPDEAGAPRDTLDSAERLRKAVTNRIRESLAKVRVQHGPLGLHLANSIRTGIFCTYSPERPTAWTL